MDDSKERIESDADDTLHHSEGNYDTAETDKYIKGLCDRLLSKEQTGYILTGSSIPLSTVLKGGPSGLMPKCLCNKSGIEKHITFFDALILDGAKEQLIDFCPNVSTFINGRLPRWSTDLRNKKQFTQLPTVYNLFRVFEHTHWWKVFRGTNRRMELSREARLLLFAATGRPLTSMPFLKTKDLLALSCSPPALTRIRNWFITLDGLLISLYLGSQGKTEICNWEFFDNVMQTYLKQAIWDLFLRTSTHQTYYEKIKEVRGLIKNICLKESKMALNMVDKSEIVYEFTTKPELWYFKYVVDVLKLNRKFQTPNSVMSLAYIVQSRASGLPPEPVRVRSLEKFKRTVSAEPKTLSDKEILEISIGTRLVLKQITQQKDYNHRLDFAAACTKISLSDSSSFFDPRSVGGKTESCRKLLRIVNNNTIPIFNLHTGEIMSYSDPKIEGGLTPGEKIFHYSVLIALHNLKLHNDSEPHIGDIRVSVVDEPGKSRTITVPRFEHSAILHPLAHFLSVLLAALDSTKAGLSAANHLWDFYTRIGFMHADPSGRHTFLGNEDWTEATDSVNPLGVRVMLETLSVLGIPPFYLDLCIKLITMFRRVYEKVPDEGHFNEKYFLKKVGILQGDPLCKQILHMIHLVSREISQLRLKDAGSRSNTAPIRKGKDDVMYGSLPRTRMVRKELNLDEQIDVVSQYFSAEHIEREKHTRYLIRHHKPLKEIPQTGLAKTVSRNFTSDKDQQFGYLNERVDESNRLASVSDTASSTRSESTKGLGLIRAGRAILSEISRVVRKKS